MYAAAMQQNPGALMMMMPYMMQTMQQGMQGLQQQQDGTPTPGAPAAAAFPGYPQMTLAAEVTEEQPTYVNAKQYRRIIKRRQARAKLEERKKIPANRKVRPFAFSLAWSQFEIPAHSRPLAAPPSLSGSVRRHRAFPMALSGFTAARLPLLRITHDLP
ncbi:unnamed protein product [Phaeothamnion confervicola]